MDKISPEEKIQWIEKIIQNKDSINSFYQNLAIW